MTNNPFALPTQESLAASRFPAVDVPQSSSFGYGQQQQQQPMQQQYSGYGQPSYAQQQPQQGTMYSQPSGSMQYQQPQATGAFQPQSSFGQYLQSQGGTVNFGVPQSSQYSGSMAHQAGSSAFYTAQPQPLNNQHVADLDPYSGRYGQQQQQPQQQQYGYAPSPQPPQQQQQQQPSFSQNQQPPQENFGEHPRHFMRANASVLETWDKTAWARVRALLSQLEKSWESRKRSVMEWQTWNLGSDDRDEVEKLRKEADNNIDVIAAYTIQIKEVFENYRHSSDQSSRAQVKQAMNLGLSSLPDWPATLSPPPKLADNQPGRTSLFDPAPQQQQQQQPQQFYQQSGYQQQQQPMYAQQTGYPQQQQPQQQQMMYAYAQQPMNTGYGQQGMYRPY
ncbi:hypothetical protein EMMF5_003916 [Cystobasidiomycetes sp. EMM_F5]